MAPLHSFMRSMLLAFACLCLCFLPLVTASPLLEHTVDSFDIADTSDCIKRQEGFVPVTGVKAYGVQPRLEIRELQQNVDQWNVYLLGLARWYATDQSDKLSYYQVAGLHGRPYIPWDGVENAPGVDSPGYCAHVSNIFLPWHRPYLALFEQTLYTHIVAAVNEFPVGAQRTKYSQAALQWRAPYWDWAMVPADGGSAFPDVLTTPKIDVTMPNGTVTIDNPLFSYKFHPVSVEDFYFNPFATWNETKRYPTSWDEDATSQNQLLGPLLDNNRKSLSDRLFNLFLYYDNFTQFGNEAWMSQDVTNADSLESVHDVIHGTVGMNGHMTYLDYSAWDPTFWLHHAMIDRCFALWQALYNTSYVEPMAAAEQTFAFAAGTLLTADSSLFPFHRNINGDFWTSDSARSTRTFGYTYKDIGNGSPDAVRSNIERLYGDSRSAKANNAQSRIAVASTQAADYEPTTKYLANILSEKFALNGSYAVYVFLGDPGTDSKSWPTSPNLVGTHAVFAALSKGDKNGFIPARQMASGRPLKTTASLPLTSKILDKIESGEIPNSDEPTVENYLKQDLHWRVAKLDGSAIPDASVANVNVTVIKVDIAPSMARASRPRPVGETLFKVDP